MTASWLGRGRRVATTAHPAGKDGAAGGRTRALGRLDDLWRRAEWPGLSPEEREAALRPYAALAIPAASPGRADEADAKTQAWVADLVAPHLQPEATAVVRTWLEDGAPNTHLLLIGSPGQGKLSVVATYARRAMAGRPPAPDYCYVPDPQVPGYFVLLALPTGSGLGFVEMLTVALQQIHARWEKPREQAENGEVADGHDETTRQDLIARHLDPVVAGTPAEARSYLDRLGAALRAQAANPISPTLGRPEAPAGRLLPPAIEGPDEAPEGATPRAGGASAAGDAPVVTAALGQADVAHWLLRANGGVLVLNAADLVERDQPNNQWNTLRTALRAEAVSLHGPSEPAVPLAVRVALVATSSVALGALYKADDFWRLFRYTAEFDNHVAWTQDAEATYATLAAGVARHYALPPFDASAVGALVEAGARWTPERNRSRVSTDLLALRDLAMEAGRRALARPDADDPATTADDVAAVLAAGRAQLEVAAREHRDAILLGRDDVPTAGAEVGQINGLSVQQMPLAGGVISFPTRLTATVSPTREERLLDIEREAKQADESHVSGALTMAGYLDWRYGGRRPISLTVRIRFEQAGMVGGPSASAAELFAVLSALAEVPIRAALAVTGAVGQHGEIQLIGRVNDKIEGFWQICRERRAQGEQPVGAYGVLIPRANLDDLMLRPEVAESIAGEAWFHVWPIAEVDEGLELLTGLPAGEIHARADRRLQHFYELAQRHGR